jgi:ribonuclease HI
MNFSDIDMEQLLNNTVDKHYKNNNDNNNNDNNDSKEYLDQFNLIFFTDGSCLGNGKQDSRNKAGFGIYILCNNENSQYYNHNDTKIIKKIDKDIILYNMNTYDIIYMNTTHNNDINAKCSTESCTYYALYGDNPSSNKDPKCKIHKTSNMILNKQYNQFSGTNIRAEGYAILYSLVYIKLVMIDSLNDKQSIIDNFKLDKLTNIKKDINIIDFKLKSRNKFMIVSDSEFWINVITKWGNNWVKKFTICEKKNLDLNILINYYMNILYNNGIEIVFQHVNGHADKNKDKILNFYERGNVMSDKLANLGNKNKDLLLKIV